MSTTIETMRNKVMSLSLSERASLAHELILSLDEPSDYELGSDQEAEIARRVQVVRDGTAKGRPAADVFDDIKAKYAR